MSKLPLELTKWTAYVPGPVGQMTSALPFVENSRGVLNHRPRSADIHKCGYRPHHLAVHYFCGSQVTGTDNITFLAEPTMLLCEACEARAVMAGLPSADEIVGRHVHVGKTKVFQTCCTGDIK